MDACQIGSSSIFHNLEPQVLTTYAVSPRFVIKESMGTGVLDSNFIPSILKSFWEPRESGLQKSGLLTSAFGKDRNLEQNQ
jgi:hypothetical protein